MLNILFKYYIIVFNLLFITVNCIGQTSILSDGNYNTPSITLTKFFQSEGDTLIIDNIGSPWFFSPNKIVNASNKVIILEKGVELNSKAGAFLNKGDALFKFIDCNNVQIIGEDNIVCMNKSEYVSGEWRHGFSFIGCTNILLRGIQIKDTGGDGIYVAGSKINKYSENIRIEEVCSTNNKRQGMSVISVKKLTVSNSIFEKTKGTLPEAGVDFEPNSKEDVLVDISFDNCVFRNNGHSGILLALSNLRSESNPISITFFNCVIQGNHRKENRYTASEIIFGADKDSPVRGSVTFEECVVKDSDWGLFYSRKTSSAYSVIFKNCVAENISQDGSFPPIYLEVPDYRKGNYDLGGYIFENLYVSYSTNVPLFLVRGSKLNTLNSVSDITGNIILNDLKKEKTSTKYLNYNPQNNDNVNFRVVHSAKSKL